MLYWTLSEKTVQRSVYLFTDGMIIYRKFWWIFFKIIQTYVN